MIEISLALKLDSFLVNSMGKSEDVSSQMSVRALKLSCEKVVAARQMTENKPTADFAFLASASKRETQADSDKEFDERLFTYLTTHTTVDVSSVNIAYGLSGYVAEQKGTGSGEIGRIYIAELPNQLRIDLELVFTQDEFDATWNLMTQQKVRNVIATLVCFELAKNPAVGHGVNLIVAGVMSCSLQLAPND
ncbi:hypothetical protein [Sideroxydans lithotrophicus]|uniref:Uncharacterized protein n=1 Tax=Sideroxydans lithotrophicus (strain ES-1) TaxID=580332 RepID=D5CPN5_SIDLE|nr:hypothetical protein [Sideroxydans lithotrophicus]ADE13030.1 hypothetical protein Slit_2805 [Sideroxydans lithotrophicus ES-1]